MPRRKKLKLDNNPTTAAMRSGRLKFTRRITLSGWHQDHWPKNAELLRELADEIDRITKINALRSVDICSHLQEYVRNMSGKFSAVTPLEVRERGAAKYEYPAGSHYMVNTIGHDEVNAREDLQESFFRHDRHNKY